MIQVPPLKEDTYFQHGFPVRVSSLRLGFHLARCVSPRVMPSPMKLRVRSRRSRASQVSRPSIRSIEFMLRLRYSRLRSRVRFSMRSMLLSCSNFAPNMIIGRSVNV